MQKLLTWIDNLIFITGGFIVTVFPIFFLPITSELSEYNKLVLLIISAMVLLILWSIKSVLSKRFVIAKTPLDLAFFLILISFVLSTWFSVSRYTSLFGAFNTWHFTLVELVSLLSVFYCLVTNINSAHRVGFLMVAFYVSAFLVGLLAWISSFGVFSSLLNNNIFQILTVKDFSLAGNRISLIILLTVALLIGVYLVRTYISKNKILTFVYTSVTTLIGFILIIWVIGLLASFTDNNTNNYQLSFSESWQVASATISKYPWLGTGVSTYSKAFLAFPPTGLDRKSVV